MPLERKHFYLIRVASEEPLLSSLNLQGYYHCVAGVHHCRAVLSPQRLQERNERAAEMSQLRCHSEPRLETTVSEIRRSHEIQMAPIISDFCHRNSRKAMHKHGLTPICRRVIFPSTNVPQAWCLWALCSPEKAAQCYR